MTIYVKFFLCVFLILMVGCGSVVRYSEIWSTPEFLRIAGDRYEQSRERDKKEWSLYESRRGVNFRIDSSNYVRSSATTWVFGAVPIPEEKEHIRQQFEIAVGLNSRISGAALNQIDGGIYYDEGRDVLMSDSVMLSERALCTALATPRGKLVERNRVQIRLYGDKSNLIDNPTPNSSAYTCLVFIFKAPLEPRRSFEFKLGMLEYPTGEKEFISVFFQPSHFNRMIR